MKKTPRHIVLEILNRVEEQDAFAEPMLDAALSHAHQMNIHDRSLITHIVYGTLRMRGRLDWIIDQLYKGDFLSMDVSIKNILRAGLYQLLFTDRIPDFAIVDEAVEIAKKTNPAGSGLVNAVLEKCHPQKGRICVSRHRGGSRMPHICFPFTPVVDGKKMDWDIWCRRSRPAVQSE